MQGYYIMPDINPREKGIYNKVNCHLNLFRSFSKVELIKIHTSKFMSKVVYRLPFGSTGGDYHKAFNLMKDPNYVYIRKGSIDRRLIGFLRRIRRNYPHCKILYEIPTYPYAQDGEKKWYNYFLGHKDRKYTQRLKQYIDRIVTYSLDESIFGCKTIIAHNGVDCNTIQPVKDFSLIPGEIRLIAVAQFRIHHGYERIIKGLGEYYKTPKAIKVTLNLVGDGLQREYYENLIKEDNLDKYITMSGTKDREELEELYNQSDIAVSSLGMYKIGLSYVSTLKNCEYAAKGLPIILAYNDYVSQDKECFLTFPNDDSQLDVERIIAFYQSIYKNGKEAVVQRIREIALKRADLKMAYKDVIEYIQG